MNASTLSPDLPPLDSCPFCGSTMHTKPGMNCWYAHCDSCQAEGPPRDTEAEAIAAANRRASSAGAAVPADLRQKIMNLWTTVPEQYAKFRTSELAYKIGHRDGRHAAAELVSAALCAAMAASQTTQEPSND